MARKNKEHIAHICELYANGHSLIQIARIKSRSVRVITSTLDKHYRMKYRNPTVMSMSSRINITEKDDNTSYNTI